MSQIRLPQEQERVCNINDIYTLPEGIRAELIDEQIHYMAAPSRMHQKMLFWMSRKIADYIDFNKGLCEVYPAPFAVYLNGDESEYFEPDISVICNPQKLNDKGCQGAPDLIIEITSPSTASKDYFLKSAKYQAAGVKEYWIVNLDAENIMINHFSSENFAPKTYTFIDKVKVNIYEDLFIDFNEFGKLNNQ